MLAVLQEEARAAQTRKDILVLVLEYLRDEGYVGQDPESYWLEGTRGSLGCVAIAWVTMLTSEAYAWYYFAYPNTFV